MLKSETLLFVGRILILMWLIWLICVEYYWSAVLLTFKLHSIKMSDVVKNNTKNYNSFFFSLFFFSLCCWISWYSTIQVEEAFFHEIKEQRWLLSESMNVEKRMYSKFVKSFNTEKKIKLWDFLWNGNHSKSSHHYNNIHHFDHHNRCSHRLSIISFHAHKSVRSLRSILSTLIRKNLWHSLVLEKDTLISPPLLKTSPNMFGTSHTEARKALHLSSPLLANKQTIQVIILLVNSKSGLMHSNPISSQTTLLLFVHATEIPNP